MRGWFGHQVLPVETERDAVYSYSAMTVSQLVYFAYFGLYCFGTAYH